MHNATQRHVQCADWDFIMTQLSQLHAKCVLQGVWLVLTLRSVWAAKLGIITLSQQITVPFAQVNVQHANHPQYVPHATPCITTTQRTKTVRSVQSPTVWLVKTVQPVSHVHKGSTLTVVLVHYANNVNWVSPDAWIVTTVHIVRLVS